MKIKKITLNNFKQYYGSVSIDLTTENNKNIVLIGGKNGYGKTNLLLALVWCLYGEDISKIDENFKHEIQKDGNYSKFLKSCSNWDAAKKGKLEYFVEIEIEEFDLPFGITDSSSSCNICKIKREYVPSKASDRLSIDIGSSYKSYFKEDEDKINFINDFIVPLEAAKFVFFDAEKIASWAELSTKEEGSILNDAVGKILGLDLYESLISDLEIYSDSLRKDSAPAHIKQQIISTEKGIQLNVENINELESLIIKKESEILKAKNDISAINIFLNTNNLKSNNSTDVSILHKQRDELENKKKELQSKFNEMCEVLPFTIMAGKLEELVEHIDKQEDLNSQIDEKKIIEEKTIDFIEKLFNQPPYPSDGDIPIFKKYFYSEKAKSLFSSLFNKDSFSQDLEFEHDLSRSEKELIKNTFNFIRNQNKDNLAVLIESANEINNKIQDISLLIKRIEMDYEDDMLIEYSNKRTELERKEYKLIEEKGGMQYKKEALKKENDKLVQNLQILLKKVSLSEQRKIKLEKANLYMETLISFVREEKHEKCKILEGLIISELKKLMHKLRDNKGSAFIDSVKVEVLPDKDGLRIILFDKTGNIRTKESLSQGEKQIYISTLIKAILALSPQEYPIFIDTPLGRLDDEHINRILTEYYPDLAEQVVLLATNNEISANRYSMVQKSISKSYLLESTENKTTIKPGYFKGYEN